MLARGKAHVTLGFSPSTNTHVRFGFAKFYDVRNSEMCIRGFHRLGYEVGFARVSPKSPNHFGSPHIRLTVAQESFNSRLKAEGDEESTNLYISNLPKTLNEVVRDKSHGCLVSR